MAEPKRCPTCDGERINGFCPRCLLRLGVDGPARSAGKLGEPGSTLETPPWMETTSVLDAIGEAVGPLPRLLLRDTEAAGALEVGAVVRPSSSEMPERAGRLHLLGEIGRGGMGAILKGRDDDLGRDLAVKVLLKRYRDRPEFVGRFIEEAQIAGQLQHPGIVPVYELGACADHRPFFAMKLVKGRTLAALLAERGDPARDLPRFLSIFEAVCQTVAYAHTRGVIHRDLKPLNVMVGSFGEVQVMDWGLAKVLSRGEAADDSGDGPGTEVDAVRTVRSGSDAGASRAGSVMGTPAYMAPEQARGEFGRVDERVDVFGLGSILCEILTGYPVFHAGSSAESLRRASSADLSETLARFGSARLDSELTGLAIDCLQAEPSARPRDARAVAARVTAYQAGVQDRFRASELARAEALARAAEERKRRRAEVGLAAAVLALVVLAGGGWLAYDRVERGRRLRTATAVQSALDVANRLEGEARTLSDLTRWGEAVAAAERAEGIDRAGGGDLRSRANVRETLARLRAGQHEARERAAAGLRAVALLKDLEEVRLRAGDLNGDRYDASVRAAAYRLAFQKYGVDVAALPEAEAAAGLQSASLREPVAAALDDWSTASSGGLAQQLMRLANRIDPDPDHSALRAAIGRRDVQALKDWAGRDGTATLPSATLAKLGSRLWELGARDAAADLLRRARARDPGDFWINYHLGNVVSGEDAVRFFNVALVLRPESPIVHGNLGAVLVNAGQFGEGMTELRRASELAPGYALAAHNIGRAFRSAGRLDEAIAAYRRTCELKPNDAEANFEAGNLFQEKARPGMPDQDDAALDEAIASYQRAIKLNPAHAGAHCHLGPLLATRGRVDESVATLRRATELDPAHAPAAYNLGMALQTAGRDEEAINYYRNMIVRWPDYAEAYCNLAGLLVDLGRNREALDWIERGHAVGSKQPGWRFPSADWLAHTRRMVALEGRLPAVLRGEDRAADDREGVEFALLSQRKGLVVTSVRLWREAFAAAPALASDVGAAHRYHAACAAARAGCNPGKGEPAPDRGARALLRMQSIDWLAADLAAWEALLKANWAQSRVALIAALQQWQRTPDLSGLRDDLAGLSEPERQACRSLWARVDGLLRVASSKEP
jgi:serine/threonine-protein kinase